MSTVGTITKLATEVVGKAAGVAGKAVGVAGKAAGVAGKAVGVAGKAAGVARTAEAPVTSPAETETATTEPPPFPEAPDIQPAEPQDPSTTEPKAASRAAAHAGRGSEPTDDWHDELDDAPDVGTNPATGLPNTTEDVDGPLIDPASTKQIKAESETMRKASDPSGE